MPVRFLLQYFVPKSMLADRDEYVEMIKAATKRYNPILSALPTINFCMRF